MLSGATTAGSPDATASAQPALHARAMLPLPQDLQFKVAEFVTGRLVWPGLEVSLSISPSPGQTQQPGLVVAELRPLRESQQYVQGPISLIAMDQVPNPVPLEFPPATASEAVPLSSFGISALATAPPVVAVPMDYAEVAPQVPPSPPVVRARRRLPPPPRRDAEQLCRARARLRPAAALSRDSSGDSHP